MGGRLFLRDRCLLAIQARIKHAEADCRDHRRDPEHIQRELDAYLRGLKDAHFAIQELKKQ